MAVLYARDDSFISILFLLQDVTQSVIAAFTMYLGTAVPFTIYYSIRDLALGPIMGFA